ncbi:MAG TPA: energy transducer TonB [Stellaceae bacterium]|jgi:protein TonB|nr:energy transducer TonB [Stellaceae bacterium]
MDGYLASRFSTARLVGLGLVVLVHVVLIYALVHALARRSIDLLQQPVEARIIAVAPPEPAKPPPPEKIAPPPKPFVPPPEVQLPSAPAAAGAITGSANAPPMVDRAQSRDPDYPAAARREGEQGSVVLQVLIGIDGRVRDARIAQSSGFADLDQAALDGIKRDYRFTPGMIDGQKREMWHTLKFTWKLR